MKLSKLALTLSLALALSACSTNNSETTFAQSEQTFQQYREITQQFQINEQWWQGYQDNELNQLIDTALANNLDLAKSAIAVNRALYNANLLGANLVPTFSGSGSSSASKGVGSTANQISTGVSNIAHQVGLNVSYTLDLWQRLADSANAAEWEHKATQQDLQATRLALINAVINSYYRLAYFQDAIRITEQSIKDYQQINKILNNKLKAGVIDRLSVEQSNQAILAAKNTLVNLHSNQKTAEQTLRNLLNLKPNQPLNLRLPNLLNVKLQGIDLNVPVSVIANRPDLAASLNRLRSAFKNLDAMEKSWFPTITLGAGISGSSAKFNNVTDNPIGNGVISVNLPFLDWQRVSNNVKISETNYETARLNYEQTVTKALNEIDSYYFAYQQSRNGFSNLQEKYRYDNRISGYYKNRYNQGIAEFREWINAMITERNSQLALLDAKYSILQNENAVYQAMAGKYQR